MTPEQRHDFIAALRESGLEATSAQRAGATMSELRREYAQDEAFKEEAMDALALKTDEAEAEAMRRAVHGIDKPVYYKGDHVDTMKEYSDSLLAKILTGRRPEVFGDKKQITGANNEPLKILIANFDDPDFL